ncbi:MAG: hypothetical protein IKP77_05815 [Acholeplasmatales bacterium]|nr:hypothetical protein [Acholeplasmatales bacterium]
MSLNGKNTRRALTLAASGVLLIALSSCSGASNNYGGLTDEVYAKTGDYTVTEKELWDELKWNSKDVLTTQIDNVIVNKFTNNISLVMSSKYENLSDDDKTNLSVTSEDEFKKLKTKYEDRLVDYVIQDIYNFNFSNKTYEDNFDSLTDNNKKKSEYTYIDEVYSNYKITKVGNYDLNNLVSIENPYESKETYLQIATDDILKQVYYPLYARELFALSKKNEEVSEADTDDTDEDDDKWGYYSTLNYISAFKSEYTNTYNVNAIMIRFTSETEFTNTLRAFGIKLFNNKYYYIKDKKDNMSYQEYIDYYDDFSNSSLNAEHNVITISDEDMLEIFVQLYNYTYGGYRDLLSTSNSNYDINSYDLNTLRKLTNKIIDEYGANEGYYKNGVNYLIENFGKDANKDNDTKVIYTSKELNKISANIKTLVYETLTETKPYSTSTTSVNEGYYIAYKLGKDLTTSKNKNYEEFYNKDKTDYEILEFIKKDDSLKNNLEQFLINEDLSDSLISTRMTTELDEVKVKIYNEACEISYLISNSTYSKTIGSNSNKNVLAVIEYNDVKYNLNIKADSNDANSIKIAGTDKPFGVYDYLEQSSGSLIAIDILSKKIIKDTKAYEETNKDRSDYEKYLQLMLLNFQNDGYSSSNYPSTIGKYNFLMMYFHSADVDTIIDNYYRVQFASSKLLTNYASDELAEFLMNYTDQAYDKYFSLTSTRLLVYFDGDEDGEADDVEDWKNKEVTNWKKIDGTTGTVTFEYVCKQLVLDIYNKLSSSTADHSTQLTSLVEEFNKTAKFQYEENPILSENVWSKYRHLGLILKTEEITATNSTTDIDFNIKSRLYDYARGHNDDNTKTYQFYINSTAPSLYMEMLTTDSVSTSNNDIVETNDGYNLLLVTKGTSTPSAKFESKDDNVSLLKDIVIKYNEKYTTITDVYNDNDKLNKNQVKLYVLDNNVNGSSTLSPEAISSAISTFLAPAVSRYTASETQRIILLSFIRTKTGQSETVEYYDVIKFTKDGYNGADGELDKIIKINQNSADDYLFVYNDITKTSNLYPDWWENIKTIVNKFLQKEGE